MSLRLRIGNAGGVTNAEQAATTRPSDDAGPVQGTSGQSRHKAGPTRHCLGDEKRRTRVVATIGPASDELATLAAMQDAGMDVARLPLAHGTIDEAVARLRRVREAAPDVGILVDLPGPKIRTTPFPEGGVVLATGSEVVLSPHDLTPQSSATHIGVSVPELSLIHI